MLDRLNRHDLTDKEWERLAGFLPADPPRGGRWADHRMVISGIFFRTRAGCPWRDLPEGFGNWKTVYNRHRRWSLDGTWAKILDGLQTRLHVPRHRRPGIDPHLAPAPRYMITGDTQAGLSSPARLSGKALSGRIGQHGMVVIVA